MLVRKSNRFTGQVVSAGNQNNFKETRLAKVEFVALGKTLNLTSITCPTYLLDGESDDITPKEQVFAAKTLFGTPAARIMERLAPGGHIGLFMGSSTLREVWPGIARWINSAT
ncbi:hypothetical protein [Methylobacterium sp. E-045]|uniref:hypothetical protein n=1 Tax=Methylobacterium sp. E-045 TaxID=2836575 RepID=UPI001FBBAB3C|nr:hypothetical protein [Methylobacterium sp. E-045]MCJ2127510.1 hypothetical protein [Methylobacterium sp. E-045]